MSIKKNGLVVATATLASTSGTREVTLTNPIEIYKKGNWRDF